MKVRALTFATLFAATLFALPDSASAEGKVMPKVRAKWNKVKAFASRHPVGTALTGVAVGSSPMWGPKAVELGTKAMVIGSEKFGQLVDLALANPVAAIMTGATVVSTGVAIKALREVKRQSNYTKDAAAWMQGAVNKLASKGEAVGNPPLQPEAKPGLFKSLASKLKSSK